MTHNGQLEEGILTMSHLNILKRFGLSPSICASHFDEIQGKRLEL